MAKLLANWTRKQLVKQIYMSSIFSERLKTWNVSEFEKQ